MSYIHYPAQAIAPKKQRYPWLVFLFVSILLFLTSHDPSGAQRTLGDYNRPQDEIVQGVSSGSMVRELSLVSLGFASVLSLACYSAPRKLRPSSRASYVLCAFACWCVFSAFWADDPALTVKRLVAFGILCITGIAIVRMFSLREIVIWAFAATATYLLIAIASEAAAGALRPWTSDYRFAGTQHPNDEGIECGLLVLSGIAACRLDRTRLWLYRSFAGAGLLFLVLTGSRTSLVATSIGVGTYFFIIKAGESKKVLVCGALVLTCGIVLLLGTGVKSAFNDAFSLKRDGGESVESFAGRTDIWLDVIPYILQHPLVGHGYGGFWTPEHITAISDEEKWGVPDSHSAYIDYVLAIGGVGLMLYVTTMFQGLWRSLCVWRLTRRTEVPFFTAVLLFGTIDGFFESSVGEGSLLTFLCIVALVWMGFVPTEEVAESSSSQSLPDAAEVVR